MAGRIPARLSPAEGRRFAFTVGAAFAALGALLWWRGHAAPAAGCAAAAGLLGLAGLAVPGRLTGVHRAWMGLAQALSRVTTPVLMGLIYFVVLTPTALLRRRFGRHPLVHPCRDDSYFVARPPGPARRSDLARQF